MRRGKCPKCGSSEIYVRQSALGGSDSSVHLNGVLGELFAIDCYLCLSCRYMELYAAENSVALWGKGKALEQVVQQSKDWQRI